MPEVRTQMIEFPSNGATTPGYLAQPSDEGQHPAVVVIQEWWGLVPHIKDVTERFAREGYVALAPDLYHGRAATEPNEAQKLAMEMNRARAIKEIHAAAQYLISLPNVAPKKVGVVGWCMGGGLACSAAAHNEDGVIGAVVAFYGRPSTEEDAQAISVPILGLYGELDQHMGAKWVETFESVLAQTGVPHHLELYPGAPHAFFNDTRESYRPEAAQDAWRRTLDWFGKYLK